MDVQEASAATSEKLAAIVKLVISLQGNWEDHHGQLITVHGNKVHFGDGTGSWPIGQALGGSLAVRGAMLAGGLPDLPVWQLPDGMQALWMRPDPAQMGDADWPSDYLTYKMTRLAIRQKYIESLDDASLVEAEAYGAAWRDGWGCPAGMAMERQARLASGRHLVPGVPVVFRKRRCRGIVVGSEPWVGATLARKLPSGPASRLEPCYHVLLDERDVPGSKATLVPESELQAREDIFPIQGSHVDRLLVAHETLPCYLPGPLVEASLRQQLAGEIFYLRRGSK